MRLRRIAREPLRTRRSSSPHSLRCFDSCFVGDRVLLATVGQPFAESCTLGDILTAFASFCNSKRSVQRLGSWPLYIVCLGKEGRKVLTSPVLEEFESDRFVTFSVMSRTAHVVVELRGLW